MICVHIYTTRISINLLILEESAQQFWTSLQPCPSVSTFGNLAMKDPYSTPRHRLVFLDRTHPKHCKTFDDNMLVAITEAQMPP